MSFRVQVGVNCQVLNLSKRSCDENLRTDNFSRYSLILQIRNVPCLITSTYSTFRFRRDSKNSLKGMFRFRRDSKNSLNGNVTMMNTQIWTAHTWPEFGKTECYVLVANDKRFCTRGRRPFVSEYPYATFLSPLGTFCRASEETQR